MFGRSTFGRTPFGRRIVEEEIIFDEGLPFSSADFLPLDIRDDELYTGLTQALDHILSKYHYEDIQKLAGLYDAFHTKFNPDQIIDLLGGANFFVRELNEEQKKSLALMLANLYEIKGLKRGIEGVLGLIGFPSRIYEAWEVADEVETGASRPVYEWDEVLQDAVEREPLFKSAIWSKTIQDCNIAIAFDITGKVVLRGIDAEVRKVVESLLWICTRLEEYVWVMNFNGPGRDDRAFLPADEHTIVEEMYLCSKFTFQNEQDFCVINKPIIECPGTPDDEKILAIFTEKAEDSDITAAREYASPDYDGFVIFDWAGVSNPPNDWGGTQWQYNQGNHELSLLYIRNLGMDAPPPIFYSVSPNDGITPSSPNGPVRISMDIQSDEPILVTTVVYTEESGVTPTIAEILNGDVRYTSDLIELLSILSNNFSDPGSLTTRFSLSTFTFQGGSQSLELDTLVPNGKPVTVILFATNPSVYGAVNVVIKNFKVTEYLFDSPSFSSYDGYVPFKKYFDIEPAPSSYQGAAGSYVSQANNKFQFPVTDLKNGQQIVISTYPSVPEILPIMYLSEVENFPEQGYSRFKLSPVPGGLPVSFSGSSVQLVESDYVSIVFNTFSPLQRGVPNTQLIGWNPYVEKRQVGVNADDYFQITNNAGNEEVSMALVPFFHSISYTLSPSKYDAEFLNTSGTRFYGLFRLTCDIEVIQGKGKVQLVSSLVRNDMIVQNTQVQGYVLELDGAGSYTFEIPSPADYLAIQDRILSFSIIPSSEISVALNADTLWDASTNEIQSPDQFADDAMIVFFFSGVANIGSVETGKFYFVVNSSWDGNYTTFQISETQGGDPIDLAAAPSGLTFFLYFPLVATITNMSVESDDDAFFTGIFTFEENTGVPESDPSYWEVHVNSEFWQVACDEEIQCCPEEITEDTYPINIGYDEHAGTLQHDDGGLVTDLSDWDFNVETSEPSFNDITNYDGTDDSSFVKVDFGWIVGTQVKLVDIGNGLPSASGHTFDEANTYYVIPYDNPSEGVWRIQLALSYADAIAGIYVVFNSNSGSELFQIQGSQLPPEYREIIP